MHTIGLPRTCLGFTNILFFMFGFVGLIICVWCALNTEFFRDVNYTITKSSLVDVVAKFVNLNLWLTPLTTILIPIALLSMMTSCCGVLGAGCKVKCAVKTYIFLVSMLSLIAFWIFFISGVYNIYTKNESTKRSLQISIRQYYGKENDFITYIWDYIMVKHECCGAVNYKDFAKSPWLKTNPNKIYPVQCCKLANVSALIPVSKDCGTNLDPEILSNKDVGCFGALRIAIVNNKGKIIFYIILIAFLYSTLTLFAYCIIRGEPLLGAMAGRFTELLPSKARDDGNKVIPSNVSLGNMVYVEEQPKKVVKVVSSANPFQSYKYTPSAYNNSEDYRHTMRK
ncbi:tetraspanin-1-like [Trichoplusia ni]|uniref:Tetraspanin-1-like n=1 Tax=Trichoplusia ni TaxID=7111 RepID=A0A7E5WSS5_TRINI|nr:tetraspanin-1-like [Trichoplusia ni]